MQTGQEPIAFGEGLTSRIIATREPLSSTARRTGTRSGPVASGTPAKSYLGVPIIVGDEAIGVISVQSTTEEGRFGEPTRACWRRSRRTSASRIQNARLYREAHRRGDEMAALAEVGQEISATLDARPSSSGSASGSRRCSTADTTALFLAEPDGRTYRAILALGELAEAIRADTIVEGEGIIGDVDPDADGASSSTTSDTDSATVVIPGTEDDPRSSA